MEPINLQKGTCAGRMFHDKHIGSKRFWREKPTNENYKRGGYSFENLVKHVAIEVCINFYLQAYSSMIHKVYIPICK